MVLMSDAVFFKARIQTRAVIGAPRPCSVHAPRRLGPNQGQIRVLRAPTKTIEPPRKLCEAKHNATGGEHTVRHRAKTIGQERSLGRIPRHNKGLGHYLGVDAQCFTVARYSMEAVFLDRCLGSMPNCFSATCHESTRNLMRSRRHMHPPAQTRGGTLRMRSSCMRRKTTALRPARSGGVHAAVNPSAHQTAMFNMLSAQGKAAQCEECAMDPCR